nr:phospho-sugar mutase [uncultured Holophaga sp.]
MSISAAREYLSSPWLEAELRSELETLVSDADRGEEAALAELADRFAEPLAFGTGGLRGIMGAGLRRMNQPNVRRATLALAEVTRRRAPGGKVAVVGYDTRINSEVFGLEAARVLAAAGYTVYLGNRPMPTPFLCFAMRRLKSACGVIVTASHNPKAYNGYKAYDDRGGQVVTPWDAEVESAMGALPLVPQPPSPEVDERILPFPKELEEAFIQMAVASLARPKVFTPARILFTPFHGTGIAFVPEIFQRAGLPLHICGPQAVQDGTFPTAPRPNPEEMGAFKVTIEEAEKLGVDAILANDPDADRLGVVLKHEGQWIQMTGNDMAGLTLDYLAREKGVKGAVVTTVVTSDFLSKVGALHGIPTVWTLTGFKNIAVCMNRLEEVGEKYAFGAEESIGMCLSADLRDKDGVSAALLVAELIGHYKAQGMNLVQAVEALQAKVGRFRNRLVNLEDPKPGGAQRFAAAMARIREAGLTRFAGEPVVSWEDFQTGEWHKADGSVVPIQDRPERPDVALEMERSNVLKFRLASGAFAAFRPSGTEPKLKVYLQSCTGSALLDSMEAEARTLLGL